MNGKARHLDMDRSLTAQESAERLQRLPLGWELKELLAGTAVVPKYTYGSENHGTTKAAMLTLKRTLELAIRGRYHQARASEVLWTVVLHGERVDPEQAMAIKAFQDIIRIIRKRSQLWATFEHIWKSSSTWIVAPVARGPVHRLAMLMRECGWQ
jgi:hypothetical protein